MVVATKFMEIVHVTSIPQQDFGKGSSVIHAILGISRLDVMFPARQLTILFAITEDSATMELVRIVPQKIPILSDKCVAQVARYLTRNVISIPCVQEAQSALVRMVVQGRGIVRMSQSATAI